MGYVIFALGSESLTFTKGREYPVRDTVSVGVVVEQSEAGQHYRYNKGIAVRTHRLVFAGLPAADAAALADFFANVAVGPTNAFTYTDEDGADHTVIFADTENPLAEVSHGRWSGTITLIEEL